MIHPHHDYLVRWTNTALVLAAIVALLGIVLRGDIGLALDTVALLLLGTLPALRVVVLAVRWERSGDRRYTAAAMALLLLMTIGVVLAAIWR